MTRPFEGGIPLPDILPGCDIYTARQWQAVEGGQAAWQLRYAELIPDSTARVEPILVETSDLAGLEPEHRAEIITQRQRAARTQPPTYIHYPIGSWLREQTFTPEGDCPPRLLAMNALYHLELHAVTADYLAWAETPPTASDRELAREGRLETVGKYVHWLELGYQPPPFKAVESLKANGRLVVTDGHHRAAAWLRVFGDRPMPVWVSLTLAGHNRPIQHAHEVHAAVLRGDPVPDAVRADYPGLAGW